MARKKLSVLLPLSLLCFSSFATMSHAQKSNTQYTDQIALVVDNQAITRKEFNSALAQARAEFRGMGLSEQAIKDEVVKTLAINKIMESIANNAGIEISDVMVDDAIRDIASRNGATVSDLKAYLQYQGIPFNQFRENIRKQIMSAELRNQMMRSIRVTDDEVDIYMRSDEFKQLQKQLANSKTPNVKVRHILVRVDNDTTEKEAKLRIDRLHERLAAGEGFEEIAKAQSQDPVSAAKGGEIGWVAPGQLVPEFEKTMLALKVGETSKPVRTPFGYHIIRVEDKKVGLPDESQIKNIARDYYYRKKAGQQYSLWQDKMLSDVYIERRF
ncbi:peptidylprolyl isomerase [Wohlfahrtiimonas chitiniclastica]|uniref:peptidylprolyl isomerase n=1 Tax=Wohlfahrtiimonas chitiniclastica TaxID=400946 RepID=UPI001BCE4A9D|nr:peptidylprolyl isomerase [Wohlfahrtiimonas chitiniclastica]MBS7838598.1 peptidylprolyl isomerase [Wohlfahrtiimonas chitiniclastica]